MKHFTTNIKMKVNSPRKAGFLLACLMLLTLIFNPVKSFSQGTSNPNEAEWNGMGYSLKKVVSNLSIQSGINFSYTIMFTAPAGATSVSIQDMIPPALKVVTVSATAPVNGVTPTWSLSGTPLLNEVVTYSLSGLPSGSASSGSFTIVVKFPEGITCDGAAARNRAGIFINDKWWYTPFVSTTAEAADPWKVTKSILSGAVVNPGGGSCGYLMEPGDTVTYRLSVLKNSPYFGNVVGQMNMSGAVVTDVLPAGAVVVSSSCGIAPGSTGTITWSPNAGNLDAANPWAYYYCDIEVYYPAASFPNGTFINNQVDLDGTMCNQAVAHTSNETCIEVGQVVASPGGYFKKYINLTNRVPGCTGYYTIIFCNNGNVNLSAFDINDVIPSGITVDKVSVYGGNATTQMDLTANSGANTIATGINSSYTSGPIGFTVNNLQLSMTSSLPVNNCIYLYIYFTVGSNPTGTVVTNCATFDGLSNSLTLPQTCVSFTVDAGAPHMCALKQICSPQSDYEPGDILRFRLRVQNIGSADLTGASIQDNLNSNFTYVGNETYYVANTYNPACAGGTGIPAGTSAWTGVSPSHSGNNLSWSLPDIDSDCQLFYVAYCGYYGTWGLPYYFIEFDVMVDSTALPGVTPNNFEITGGNLSSTVTSNNVHALVVASFGQEVEKQLSTDGGSTFASSGTVSPGGTARYRLSYKNTSNVPVTSVELVDLLPRDDAPNDWLVLNRSVSRGSQFDVTYNLNHTTSLLPSGSAPVPTLTYAPGLNICLPSFGINTVCTATTWGATPNQNIDVDYGSFVLTSNVAVREEFDVLIPLNATNQQTVCNDFAAISTADFLLDGVAQSVALTPIAAPPVCLTVDTTTTSGSCCDSVQVNMTQDPTGMDQCCAQIITDCEVDSIAVSISNGVFSTATWNCGTAPSGYAGQSSFTFDANLCAVDLTTCVKADSTGLVTIDYVIYFQNGETCEKRIQFDCIVKEECCDNVKVNMVQDPDLQDECCARIVTGCEVDSISVNISNGVFGSASWNCGALPSGYAGQSSYTFDANLCAVDLTTCVNADSTGLVTIDYVIYFQNGETCEKRIQFDCIVKEKCCDNVKAYAVPDASPTGSCCVKLETECEVDSVTVSIDNGVISSNAWTCGTLPSGYVGQSSYTFDAAMCAVDMTTCVDPDSTGVVTVNYTIYFANGEKCEKRVQLDCIDLQKDCCENVKLEQVVNDDGTTECCVKLITDCDVESIEINVSNGTIGTSNWNCGTLPSGYFGQSNFTFNANGCAVDMKNCFDAIQTGPVTVSYAITFMNGEKCEKKIEFECEAPSADCCALIDFKLKHQWPHFNSLVGTFNITNLDPSSPICSVEITASPAATFSTGSLIVDGVPSSQLWNSTSIPASGSLSPSAINDMSFSLIGNSYKGVITVCVVKCDGTRCCFDFKWNKKPIIDIGIEIGQLPVPGKLVAVTVNPVISTQTDETVKYVSFGMSDETEIKESGAEFFAISASKHEGDEYPQNLTAPVAAYMGKHNAFFELMQPKGSGEDLGAFNLVVSNKLPQLGCTLFDKEGNILFSGNIDVAESDTITSAEQSPGMMNMFEFINLYPNPSNGSFNVKYATGSQREVKIQVVNSIGQVVKLITSDSDRPGIHELNIDSNDLPGGLYKVVLYSEGDILSRSAVFKQ